MAEVFTPYSTVAALGGVKPTWIPDELDQQRIMSYITYEEIYWNYPGVFKLTQRGTNALPLYVPSGRAIVEATNRYTAPDFGVVCAGPNGVTPDSTAANLSLTAFLRREGFIGQFNGGKRYGIIRGDWVWHITADPSKAAGSRISVTSIDPGMYFPITDEEDVDKIIGVHLVDAITTKAGPRIRRLTYRKVPNASGVNTITVEDAIFKVDEWDGPTARPETIIQAVTALPPEITSIPVYHIKNTLSPGDPFGSSELRGLEGLMAGLNQTMSDEDLALALDGIGVYATDASQPVDPVTKKATSWQMGPGRVVHHDGTVFARVQGVNGLGDSYGAHYDRIWAAMKQAASTPDIALGAVDVAVAASGVALALQLGPMLSKAGEKNGLILDTHNQMFYDWLNMWEPAYEDNSYDDTTISCTVGSAVPVDRVQRFAELDDMLDRGVIDTTYYRSEVAKLGYVFPDDIGAKADAEFASRSASAAGVAPGSGTFNDRLNAETGNGSQP